MVGDINVINLINVSDDIMIMFEQLTIGNDVGCNIVMVSGEIYIVAPSLTST